MLALIPSLIGRMFGMFTTLLRVMHLAPKGEAVKRAGRYLTFYFGASPLVVYAWMFMLIILVLITWGLFFIGLSILLSLR